MSNWQSFKKKHVLLMNAAFTVAIPAAVWLIMELLNLAFCGVHTLNSTVDYTTLMRNLVTSFCFALGLNCNLPVGRMDTSTGSQMYLACMLIVNTDHGFFLSEHGYWGKGGSPNYEELVHTPLFIWDPRSGRKGVHSPALVQTIDLAPTVLDYFGIEIPADMLGRPLTQTLADDTPVREYALFGYHSMPVGITDGRYTLLRDVKDFDEKTYEYTQMPTHMRAMFSVEEMRTATMAPGFSYTKGTPVMKIEARPNPRFLHTLKGSDMLFDLQNDPHQEHVLEDAEQSDRLLTAMTAAFEENDAPEEMYRRYGLKQYRKKAE